jgi:trans-AT polyketide synthase, acyltransferase and oxidoreductase domains
VVAYLFPGQGSQQLGMGKELFGDFKELTDLADEILGYSIRTLCVEDPDDRINFTHYTQPALYVVNALSYYRLLEEGGKQPDRVAGHSLGEYNALLAADVFDFATGLRLVKKRGELMGRAEGGGMAAVLGKTEKEIRDILRDGGFDTIDIANLNAPTQTVLSGLRADIERARSAFEATKALKYAVLTVSGAFHSRYMADAQREFAAYVGTFELRPPAVPVIANVTARPYREGEIQQTLVAQIGSAVKWSESIRYLMGKGETNLVQVGPGRVLTSLLRSIKRESEPLILTDEPEEPPVPVLPAAALEPAAPGAAVALGAAAPAALAASASSAAAGVRVGESVAAASAVTPSASQVVAVPAAPASDAAATPAATTAAPAGARVRGSAATAPAVAAVPAAPAAPAQAVSAPVGAAPFVPAQRGTAAPPAAAGPAQQLRAADFGSASFKRDYGLRYACLTGGMYQGVASKEMIAAVARAGMLGFLGTSGLPLHRIEADIAHLKRTLTGGEPYGVNLVSDPGTPRREEEAVDLYLRHDVRTVEASAFITMTPAIVRYRLTGLRRDATTGHVVALNRIIAKVSRPEVATAFLSPAPARIVDRLLADGRVTAQEAELAREIPMAEDLCFEADSGGHTDQGVAFSLMPAMLRLRDDMMARHGYHKRVRLGAAGGIGTPDAAVACFVMGADFIMTGSINQCTVEAGTSELVKELPQGINIQDTGYAPAGDMFEYGARIQVLKKGVLFPARANKLYELYKRHESLDEIDAATAEQLQTRYFRRSFDDVYAEVRAVHQHQPEEIEKAELNPKHKMALVFRWYFDYSTRQALTGADEGRVDFQVHCGPALGAFNQWVRGTELEDWRRRRVGEINHRILEEAATRLSRKLAALGTD